MSDPILTGDIVDYSERKKPDVFKPMIDEALMRIARAVGADEDAVASKLADLDPEGGPWNYLSRESTPAVRDLLVNDTLREVMPYDRGTKLLDNTLDQHLEAFDWVETEADVEPDAWSRPVVLEYYPEESLECLRQGMYVGGADADIIALWDRGDRHSICHAHMEGFWILGEDPVDWIEKIADKVEEKVGAEA